MENKIKIQSTSDIITNSSSEVFIFRSDLDYKFLKKMIAEHYDKHFLNYNDPNYDKKKSAGKYNTYSGWAEDPHFKKFDKELADTWDIERPLSNDDGDLYFLELDHNSDATISWAEETFKEIERID